MKIADKLRDANNRLSNARYCLKYSLSTEETARIKDRIATLERYRATVVENANTIDIILERLVGDAV